MQQLTRVRNCYKRWSDNKNTQKRVSTETQRPRRRSQRRLASRSGRAALTFSCLATCASWTDIQALCTANKSAQLQKQTDVACTCASGAATQGPVFLHADVSVQVTLCQGEFHLCTRLSILAV